MDMTCGYVLRRLLDDTQNTTAFYSCFLEGVNAASTHSRRRD